MNKPEINPEAFTEPEIPRQKELFFCFSKITNCKKSQKNLESQTKWYKKLLQGLFKFTELFNQRTHKESSSLHAIGHMDYKKLQGTIEGHTHKFMLSQSHGIITTETDTNNALIVHLGKLDNHH